MLRILKDSFYNNVTERQTVTARGSLCTREAFCLLVSAHLLTTIVVVQQNYQKTIQNRIFLN